MLFNVYTNDQPIMQHTTHFLYADDLAVTCQDKSFEVVERRLTEVLQKLSEYYCQNQLRANPAKTQVTVFHLRNKEANRQLNVEWQGSRLEFTNSPKYLGVTLDRTLSYKTHCCNTGMKISARNNILRKLVGSSWGAHPHTLRTSALALCNSVAEYAGSVWLQSAHVNRVDVALNESCRIITGCLKPTPVDKVRVLSGIAPPSIRRQVAAETEKSRQENDPRHLLFNYTHPPRRLKSRKSFMAITPAITSSPESERLSRWRTYVMQSPAEGWIMPAEALPPGADNGYVIWKTMNRLRTGVGRTKDNLVKWKLASESKCSCGEEQNIDHLYSCASCPVQCSPDDILISNDNGVAFAKFWSDVI